MSELMEDIVSDATAEQRSQAASPGKMKDGPVRQEEPAGRQEESLVETEKTSSQLDNKDQIDGSGQVTDHDNQLDNKDQIDGSGQVTDHDNQLDNGNKAGSLSQDKPASSKPNCSVNLKRIKVPNNLPSVSEEPPKGSHKKIGKTKFKTNKGRLVNAAKKKGLVVIVPGDETMVSLENARPEVGRGSQEKPAVVTENIAQEELEGAGISGDNVGTSFIDRWRRDIEHIRQNSSIEEDNEYLDQNRENNEMERKGRNYDGQLDDVEDALNNLGPEEDEGIEDESGGNVHAGGREQSWLSSSQTDSFASLENRKRNSSLSSVKRSDKPNTDCRENADITEFDGNSGENNIDDSGYHSPPPSSGEDADNENEIKDEPVYSEDVEIEIIEVIEETQVKKEAINEAQLARLASQAIRTAARTNEIEKVNHLKTKKQMETDRINELLEDMDNDREKEKEEKENIQAREERNYEAQMAIHNERMAIHNERIAIHNEKLKDCNRDYQDVTRTYDYRRGKRPELIKEKYNIMLQAEENEFQVTQQARLDEAKYLSEAVNNECRGLSTIQAVDKYNFLSTDAIERNKMAKRKFRENCEKEETEKNQEEWRERQKRRFQDWQHREREDPEVQENGVDRGEVREDRGRQPQRQQQPRSPRPLRVPGQLGNFSQKGNKRLVQRCPRACGAGDSTNKFQKNERLAKHSLHECVKKDQDEPNGDKDMYAVLKIGRYVKLQEKKKHSKSDETILTADVKETARLCPNFDQSLCPVTDQNPQGVGTHNQRCNDAGEHLNHYIYSLEPTYLLICLVCQASTKRPFGALLDTLDLDYEHYGNIGLGRPESDIKFGIVARISDSEFKKDEEFNRMFGVWRMQKDDARNWQPSLSAAATLHAQRFHCVKADPEVWYNCKKHMVDNKLLRANIDLIRVPIYEGYKDSERMRELINDMQARGLDEDNEVFWSRTNTFMGEKNSIKQKFLEKLNKIKDKLEANPDAFHIQKLPPCLVGPNFTLEEEEPNQE